MKDLLDQCESHKMQCLEVWGGLSAANSDIDLPGLRAWVYAKPYRDHACGGDIHYVSLCGKGLLTRFVVADVSGHGDAATELAGRLRQLMAENMTTLDQADMVRDLNREFGRLGRENTFATAVLASYVRPKQSLVIVNAGHPRPLHYSRSEDQWQIIEHDADIEHVKFKNLPLGVIDGTDYHQFSVKFHPGDLMVLYTDSAIEAADVRGRQLGQQGLLELARNIDIDDASQVNSQLMQGVADHRGGQPPEDDMTLLTMLCVDQPD